MKRLIPILILLLLIALACARSTASENQAANTIYKLATGTALSARGTQLARELTVSAPASEPTATAEDILEQIYHYATATAQAWQTQTAQPTKVIDTIYQLATATSRAATEAAQAEMPARTLAPIYAAKSPGLYKVGEQIAPGLWRSQGSGPRCFWEIIDQNGALLASYYGLAGGVMDIPSEADRVTLGSACGRWTFIGEQ